MFRYAFADASCELNAVCSNSNVTLISAKKQKPFIKSPDKEFTIPFFRNLINLIKNQFNIIAALEITLKTFHNPESILIIEHIIDDIKSGASLSAAISKFARYFDNLTIKTIELAEKTAQLPEAISNVIEYLESNLKIRQKIRNAISYPVFLLCSVGFVFLFWIWVIVPKFAELFSEMGTALPFYTKLIIKLSNFLTNNTLYIVLFLAGGIALFRKRFKQIIFKIPVISKIKREIRISNFFKSMDIMLKAKINLIDCLRALRDSYPQTDDIIKLIQSGNSFSKSLSKSRIFESFDTAIIETAEKSGCLNSAFQSIVSLSDNYIQRKLDELIKLIPTISICFIGLLLVLIVCSLVIPMYSGMNIYI